MSKIRLRNSTGRRFGREVHFEYGEDLFGYLYLDIARGKEHLLKKTRTYIFENTRDFVCTLDIELYNEENRNYIPV